MNIHEKYTTKVTSIPSRPGCWNCLRVEIFQADEKVGEYERTYCSQYRTFMPFTQNGKEYALYSSHYTITEVMELPSCKRIAGEEKQQWGFCPVDFFVPEEKPEVGLNGQFGFVAGCIWGDDSSWKIEFLDLSKISEGIIVRDNRFGYISMPNKLNLSESIDLSNYSCPPDEPVEYHDHLVEVLSSQIFDISRSPKTT